MVDGLSLGACVLAIICLLLSAVQAVLPARHVWGRYARLAVQVLLSAVHISAASVMLGSIKSQEYYIYIVTSAAYLLMFGFLDLAREGTFQLRAGFSDLPLVTIRATIAISFIALLHIGLSFGLLVLPDPVPPLNYCGHSRYLLRDIGPWFGGAVYAFWTFYEYAGAFCCGPWTRSIVCGGKNETRDDDERTLWIQHRVTAAIGAEATIELLQVTFVVCTLVFSCALTETASRRARICSGIVAASTRAVPLLAISSATLAGRFFAARIREMALVRLS